MEKETTKPRLFFFGDSFVQWHLPNPGHWTERFSDEYEVYRLGSSGASNDAIVGQIGVLPEYREGDRIVICLTEPSRVSKWTHCNEYAGWIEYREKLLEGKPIDNCFVESIYKVRLHKDDLLNKITDSPFHLYVDNPLQTLNLLAFLRRELKRYKPVYVTWDKNLVELEPIKHMVTLIELGTFTSIGDEAPENTVDDYHPGVEGGKVWYSTVKGLLNNWEPITYIPQQIGTSYFEPGVDYIQNVTALYSSSSNLI